MNVVLLAVVVVAAAIVGDSVGYEVGKRLGPRLLRTRMFQRQQTKVDRARAFLDGRGASAIFVGRFTAFLRAVTPGLAGLSGMRYRRFLAWNAAGGLVWGLACVVGGYVAGSSYERVAGYLGQGGAAAAAVFVVVALVGVAAGPAARPATRGGRAGGGARDCSAWKLTSLSWVPASPAW